ncbi:uncharacterized protein K02A2.6-like isoform X1 [Aedes albopictus]|uniref:RNA-directed DNA polymerase n=1 Tax=Aedes albopictus TaxID=7160 RepID=A0ABM1XL47_AEDAL
MTFASNIQCFNWVFCFITQGLFRYKRLVFGISCAPEVFQKTIEQILSDCDHTINFIDDIIVVGRTEREHDEELRKVLGRLRDYGILLNQDKCAFKLTAIDFLGHKFDKDGMTPSTSKIEALQSFRAPATCEEVRSFLGLVNYVGAFIPDLATISFPLRELTKNKAVFKWNLEEQKAFDKLLKAISHIDRLSHFDPGLKTRVVADASPVGLGAVFLQFFEGMPRVISYASKSLTETEQRYAQTEKEALALVWAVERFQIYLVGIKFELETDHKPLEAIFSPDSSPCLRVERWVLRLQAFSYEVVYRKGKANIADSLSRLAQSQVLEPFDPDCDVYVRNVLELEAVDIGELEKASSEDPELRELREYLDRGVWNYTSSTVKAYHAFRNELGKVGELVVRGSRLIVPASMRQRMLQLAHEGHPGRTKMQQRLRLSYWWPGMDESIARIVDSCEGCRLVGQPDRPEPMERRKLPEAPWIDIAIDFLGPLPSGDYLLVIIDYYSRYKEVEILQKITAKETSERLEKIFVRLGFPRTITLDNGRQFVSVEFERYCRNRGIILNKTTPYWPQENGLVERQNRSLMKRLKISQVLNRDWKRELLTYLSMYYSTPHSTTGTTPAELMFGRNIRTKLPTLRDLSTEAPPTEYRDRDLQQKERGKVTEDLRRRAKPSELNVGDEVYMKNVLPGNKLTPTFNPKVMTVAAKQGSRVTVQNNETGKSYDRNSSHLKKVVFGNSGQNDDEETNAESLNEANPTSSGNMHVTIPEVEDPPSEEVPIDQEKPDHRNRSQREIRKPKRFDDCILDY